MVKDFVICHTGEMCIRIDGATEPIDTRVASRVVSTCVRR